MSRLVARRSISLSVRLTAVFAGTLVVLLAALCLVVVAQINRIVVPLTENLGEQVVHARAAEVGRWVEGKLAIVENLASLPVFTSGDTGAIHAFMDTRGAVKNADFEEEVYVNLEGQSYGSAGTVVSVLERPYYKAIIGGGARTFTSGALISKGSGNPIVIVAAAIRDTTGATQGLVFGTVTLARLTEIVADIRLGEAGYGWIIDGTGLVIAHHDDAYRMKLNVTAAEEAGFTGLSGVAEAATKGLEAITRVRTPKGSSEVVIQDRIPSTAGWTFAVSVPEAQITREASRLTMVVILMCLGILVAACVIAMTYARRIGRPTRFLAEKADRFAKGEITLSEVERQSLAATSRRTDEIGLMASSFGELTGYLEDTVRVARSIAGGDLRVEVAVRSDADALGAAHREMVRSLGELLAAVRVSVDQVSSGADQIAQASQSLSQGASEQASSLEEVTSSLTEVNGQSRENAESASKATVLARDATESAAVGKTGMDELRAAMQRVNESSAKIGTIVKVIDDIAFQINLLALNANVEAARAGKYGKGFAVVADEVRNLAVRSAQAVKETTGMVEEARRAIGAGAKSTEAAASRLEGIVKGTSGVAEILASIATASQVQADRVGQVTAGLDQINQVTQSNTSSAEQSAAASEELASQAKHLGALVERFHLAENGSLTPVAVTARSGG